MRSKQTAIEGKAGGALPGSGTAARRWLTPSLYVAFLLLAAFSVSGAACIPESVWNASDAKGAADSYAQTITAELADPNPDLMLIGTNLNSLENTLETFNDQVPYLLPGDQLVWKPQIAAMKAEIADLTDQFNRLGGWGVANAQHQVLTSGGTWNWVALGTNPDLNPGGPTFTGTSPSGASGCPPGFTFIIGVGCVH